MGATSSSRLSYSVENPFHFASSYVNHLLNAAGSAVTTIGRGNGNMLVLLDVSVVFDTIDHDNLYCILRNM